MTIASLFGYKRWETVRPIFDGLAHKDLVKLKLGEPLSIKGVNAVKRVWGTIPVFIFTPEGK